MDFKSRFEGRKAFINKAGNLSDAENQLVTVLQKPTQTRNPPLADPTNRINQPELSFGARHGPSG